LTAADTAGEECAASAVAHRSPFPSSVDHRRPLKFSLTRQLGGLLAIRVWPDRKHHAAEQIHYRGELHEEYRRHE
jgi:hypothetical protein